MSQFTDEEYYYFFHLCEVFSDGINSVADGINIASNIKKLFYVAKNQGYRISRAMEGKRVSEK